jgi:CubicO group peptidase (beta-lactamase class C family)
MKRYSITCILLLLAFFHYTCQQSPKKFDQEGLPPEVVETIYKRVAEGVTPSMALALIDSSGVRYFNFGKTAADGNAVDENTIYEIGSISKVFTGILLAQQVLNGALRLDDPINEFLPDSVVVPVLIGSTEITFGNLTDHTSGLPGMPDNFEPANPNNPYADYTVEQLYEFISTYTPTRAVGTAYEYSNLAQGLLGQLLAKNKNTNYEALMVETIANPLDMNDTRIELTEQMKKHLALGHSGGQVVENWDIPTLAGAGAIRSSTADMAKFIAANLGYRNTKLAKAMELSHKTRHDKAGDMSVAMAWHIKKGAHGAVIWHNGGTGGYRTFAGFIKESGKGVVLLTNSSRGADDIGFHLLDPESKLETLKFKSDAVVVPETTLEKYVGVYELEPEFTITLTKETTHLFAQATGQEKFEIYAENDTLFFQPSIGVELSFQHTEGNVEGLTLIQGGQKIPGKKIEYQK